jgi:hypothetical protein
LDGIDEPTEHLFLGTPTRVTFLQLFDGDWLWAMDVIVCVVGA